MTTYHPATEYLDDADRVYLPLLGPNRSCLRLNGPASALWRRALGGPVDRGGLTEVDARFLDRLVAGGALVAVHPGGGAR